MSFQAHTDYFGLSTAASSAFVITDSAENKTAQTVNGRDEKGDIVAYEVFGEQMAPTCSYVLKADASLASLVIGSPITVGTDKITVTNVSISTSAGSPPRIDVSGEQIPSDTTHSDCKYTIPTATLAVCHHAQTLWSAFTLTGTGCYLIEANYTAGGTLTKAQKDGDPVAFDVSDGQLTATITIQQTGTTDPTLTPGTGWVVTSPLTPSRADSSLRTWTATLSKYLTHDATSNS
jgi:hypothetical protein